MCPVFFFCHTVCAARDILAFSILWNNSFSFVTEVGLSGPIQVPHGPSGEEVDSVNLEHLVPQPLGLSWYWLPVPLLSGDPCEMGC